MALTSRAEWLEADGLGGFSSGAVDGTRTRRYHALLLAATTPPTGRLVLVNGLDAWVETPAGRYAITSQRYGPDVVHPDGGRRLQGFEAEPWPRWMVVLEDGTRLVHEVLVPRERAAVVLAWRLLSRAEGITLAVRPFLSGRDYHALHHENGDFRFEADVAEGRVVWHPYASVPGIVALTNGAYRHDPLWYRSFTYAEERARGLDFAEDLAAPGLLRFDLSKGEAVLILAAEGLGAPLPDGRSPEALARALRTAERRRRGALPTRLHRAADAYLVRRGRGLTIIAGYPWFTDWGRDTFIALRGLCLAGGRPDDARAILVEWAHAVSEGMLPNRFRDRADTAPEYNSVDASLWYVVAAYEWLQGMEAHGKRVAKKDRKALEGAVLAILECYARGTRHHIRMDADGLLAAGQPGVQLTWMDVKVGDWVVSPRVGKPVEVQALWLNALRIGSAFAERWREPLERGRRSFEERFWNEAQGGLYDVVDDGHRPGVVDSAVRPNQILAVGGLPFPLLEGERARRVVAAVEDRLWTPLGLRILAPGEPGYAPRYIGGVREAYSL